MNQLTISINLVKYTIDNRMFTLIQRCEMLSIMIPRFCFHEKLSIAGNCRMCLVEIKGSPKPVIACSTKVISGLDVRTNSSIVRKIRENIIEFLLINHPLDCPICDQGGECDLQDQTLVYGSDKGRFREFKRSVFDKNFGPFIKTVMTRCIHCTKCVRFIEEYTSHSKLGTLGRGGETEIGSYIKTVIESDLSGNIIDLCPVGALTSKPYAFKARPWELTSVESLDIFDSIGSNILIQIRGNEVMRILPRKNDNINENWITDQIRFGYDATKKQRLIIPYIKEITLKPVSWKQALYYIETNLGSILNLKKKNAFSNIYFLGGNNMDTRSTYLSKLFCLIHGIKNLNSTYSDQAMKGYSKLRNNYILNSSFNNLEVQEFFLITGLDIEQDLPILSVKLKKISKNIHRKGLVEYAQIGPPSRLTSAIVHYGISNTVLLNCSYGKNFISKKIKGRSVASLFNLNFSFFHLMKYNTSRWLNLPILFNSNDLHKLELNSTAFASTVTKDVKINSIKLFYLIGDTSDLCWKYLGKSVFKIYQGSSFHDIYSSFDVFLPSTNFMEHASHYVNLEGRVQSTYKAITNPGKAKSDWEILTLLTISFSNIVQKYYNNDVIARNIVLLKNNYTLYQWHFPYLNSLNNINCFFFISSHSTNKWFKHKVLSHKKNDKYNTYFRNSTVLGKKKIYNEKSINFFNL